MKALALDLGARLGWATVNGIIRRSGALRVVPSGEHAPGTRWVNMRIELAKLREAHGPFDVIVFEDVKRHVGTRAAHVYGGFKAILEMTAALEHVALYPVGVSTLKKHATGKGNATKEQMIEALSRCGLTITDDNEADAFWLLDYYLTHGRPGAAPPDQQDPTRPAP